MPENTDLSLAQERVEDDEEDDEVTQDEVERMAENLGTEEKEEFYDLESDPSDDDEENLEE